ncbi:MAG: hypothetical protein RJB66_223 [Pseudomonadota bacterium]|jgi:hypothetical protein
MTNPRSLLLWQLIVIPLIILIFKLPGEKKWLSLLANGVFLTTALLAITFRGQQRRFLVFAGFQFLFAAVLPISVLRLVSWQGDFNTETFFGITGSQWHSFSNLSFLLMMTLTAFATLRVSLKGFQK